MKRRSMEVQSDKELLDAAAASSSLKIAFEMRRRLNPHHPRSHKEYEALKVNLELAEIDKAIINYVWPRRVELLTSPDEEIRKALTGLKDIISLPIEDLLGRIEMEKLVLTCRLEEVEAQMKKESEDVSLSEDW